MAEYRLGKLFALKFDSILMACKTSATLDLTNEGVTVVNDCTGDYGVQLEGGTKSGTLAFEFDLDFDANGITSQSGFDLVPLLGTVANVIFGQDSTAGERYFSFDGRLDSISIASSTNDRITGSGSLSISGTPQILVTPT